jgi:signal transduction histidine kinase
VVTLDSSRLFAQLSPAELKALRWVAQERRYAAGQEIFKEGDSGDGIYIVKEGMVEISAAVGSGVRRVFSRVPPGDFFGEMAVLDYKQRSAWATAAVDTQTYFIPRLEILQLIERSPVLSMSLRREISNRLREFSRQYVEEAVETERLAVLGRFAAAVLHDLKNPLSIIGLASRRIEAQSDQASAARNAQVIQKQTERIQDLVGEVLEYTRGVGKGAMLAPAAYDAFVRQVLEELAGELDLESTSIQVEGELPACVVNINPKRLVRVFQNFVHNAAEAMIGGGQIIARFHLTPSEVVTEIEDSGPGIAPEIADRLFEPFATHGKAQGTGLGLSICKRIIEDHKGWIAAANRPGAGAVFSFGLPLAGSQKSAARP